MQSNQYAWFNFNLQKSITTSVDNVRQKCVNENSIRVDKAKLNRCNDMVIFLCYFYSIY